jgi:hypothetical protein
MQMRVDVEALMLKHGPTQSLVDRSDRCCMVACHGHVFYLAAHTYGRQWITLLKREDLVDQLAKAAPPQNAETLARSRR